MVVRDGIEGLLGELPMGRLIQDDERAELGVDFDDGALAVTEAVSVVRSVVVSDAGEVLVPTAPAPEPEPEEGANIIVVENNDAQGFVADCLRHGDAKPQAPAYTINPPARGGGGQSADGTLIWGWIHGGDGSRELSVDFLEDGTWQRPLDQRFGPIEMQDE